MIPLALFAVGASADLQPALGGKVVDAR